MSRKNRKNKKVNNGAFGKPSNEGRGQRPALNMREMDFLRKNRELVDTINAKREDRPSFIRYESEMAMSLDGDIVPAVRVLFGPDSKHMLRLEFAIMDRPCSNECDAINEANRIIKTASLAVPDEVFGKTLINVGTGRIQPLNY